MDKAMYITQEGHGFESPQTPWGIAYSWQLAFDINSFRHCSCFTCSRDSAWSRPRWLWSSASALSFLASSVFSCSVPAVFTSTSALSFLTSVVRLITSSVNFVSLLDHTFSLSLSSYRNFRICCSKAAVLAFRSFLLSCSWRCNELSSPVCFPCSFHIQLTSSFAHATSRINSSFMRYSDT